MLLIVRVLCNDGMPACAQAAALTKVLEERDEEFVPDVFWTAGYDPPFRLQHRHNEIWILKKESGSVLTKELDS